MLTPDKYVRKGYIAALATATGLPVYYKKVPKSVKPVPPSYILLTSQQKERTEVSKNCWEWLIQIQVEVTQVLDNGFSNKNYVDDAEGQVITAIEAGILVDNFVVKSTDLFTSQDLSIDTDTQSIERNVLIYEHWVCQV